MARRVLLIIIAAIIVLSTGCSQNPKRNASIQSESLNPLGISGLRFWDESKILVDNYDVDNAIASLAKHGVKSGEINHLALSGGGFDGAFSAGVLNAWSETGTRPAFDVVTGVSTGAIVAIFAYLGTDYDEELKNYYTQTAAEDMFKRNSIFSLPFASAIVDPRGFETKVREAIDETMLEHIALERSKGRILLIGTTSLDSEKMAVWDIGQIALIGTLEAQHLIQDIVLASSSIPGVFPATRISFSHDEKEVDELHVDGGVSRQVFLVPQGLKAVSIPIDLKKNIYVIRNGYISPRFEEVNNSLTSVSYRAINILIRRQGIGDIEHIYHYSERNHIDFNLAYIDSDFIPNNKSSFSIEYMQGLYEYGYNKQMQAELWVKELPDF